MRCANPMCNRGIGLVSHRVGWFDKRYACSKICRTELVADIRRERFLTWRRAAVSWLAAHDFPHAREAYPLRAELRVRTRAR